MEIDTLVNEIKDKLAEFNLKKLKSIKIKFEPLNNNKMPLEYEKLWKKYANHPSRSTDKEKDLLADYMNRYGLPK